MNTPSNLAEYLLQRLSRQGVKRIFGVPGGGSSLALIAAAASADIEFVLARTETAATLMAAVSGEIGTAPGVALTGIGPGAASATNGVAYASLERAPLLLLTDGPASSAHQGFDQQALFAPISKISLCLHPQAAITDIEIAIHAALHPPQGPVHLNITATDANSPLPRPACFPASTDTHGPCAASFDPKSLVQARDLLKGSVHPLIIAGLESRLPGGPAALKALTEALDCPVLLSYKANGVLAIDHANRIGLFTGASAEMAIFEHADLLVLLGFDPVEKIPGPWPDGLAVLNLRLSTQTGNSIPHPCQLTGPLEHSVRQLLPAAVPSTWCADDFQRQREYLQSKLSLVGTGRTVTMVMNTLVKLCPRQTRLCVDAGAHMFSAMQLWPAKACYDVLKSNGLSTMGFALPAAIAVSLQEPDPTVIAITGDGGLLMCLGELTTAVARRCRIVVLVINDAALSLIDIKQQQQQLACNGVRYPPVNFAATARALGCTAWQVNEGDDLSAILQIALACDGPAVVDIRVDASGYMQQLNALRG